MDTKLTFTGGEPNINFDDILRTPDATRLAFTQVFRAFGDNYILQGVTGTSPVTAGYVMLDGEIVQVDSHTATDTNVEKITTFEAGGDKTFNDATPRQTWQKNRATVTAAAGGFVYSGADRLEDRIIITMAANSNEELALVNIPGTGGLITLDPVDIGDWNMDSAADDITVVHGLPDHTKVREVDVIIRNDTGSVVRPLTSVRVSDSVIQGGIGNITATTIALARLTGGDFADPAYDSTSYNRGWITFKVLP